MEELMTKLKAIKQDQDVYNLGYTKCLGKMEDVYPTFPQTILDDWYRTWIWENEKGERIATGDEGNSWCQYMCDGASEKLLDHLQKRTEELEKTAGNSFIQEGEEKDESSNR